MNKQFALSIVVFIGFLNLSYAGALFTPAESQGISSDEQKQVLQWESTLKPSERAGRKLIRIDWEQMGRPIEQQEVFTLDLLGTQSLQIQPKKLTYNTESDFVWEGQVQGDLTGSLVLIHKKDGSIGRLSWFGKSYMLVQLTANLFVLQKLGLNSEAWACPSSRQDNLWQPKRLGPVTEPQKNTKDDGTSIDVVFLFTPEAVTDIKNQTTLNIDPNYVIESAMVYLNDTMVEDNITLKFRAVHYDIVDYADSGSFSTDLYNLMNGSSGFLDQVPKIRDRFGADIVVLAVSQLDVAGAGTINSLPADPNRAFIVMNWSYLFSGQIFAHEMGHVLGLEHDAYTTGSTSTLGGAYSYGHGYVDTTNKFLTIMSYGNECSAAGVYCNPLQHFSAAPSSGLGYSGLPIGNDTISNSRQAIINIKQDIARFRNSIDDPGAQNLNEAKGCFIASAAFGSFLHPKLRVFRSFRDHVLMEFGWGRSFVNWYYDHSPAYAVFLQNHEGIRTLVRWVLLLVAWVIEYLWTVFGGLLLLSLFILGRRIEILR